MPKPTTKAYNCKKLSKKKAFALNLAKKHLKSKIRTRPSPGMNSFGPLKINPHFVSDIWISDLLRGHLGIVIRSSRNRLLIKTRRGKKIRKACNDYLQRKLKQIEQ